LLLQKYDPQWKTMFHEIKEIFEKELNGLIKSVEHIGSTSVPGLAAKPIIDIDIVVKDSTNLSDIILLLEQIGYEHIGDKGIPGRESFKRSFVTPAHPRLDSIGHHLYVCSEKNVELERHLKFRDFLRANDRARLEYQKLKLILAEETNQNHNMYASLKEVRASDFIESIINNSVNYKKIK
jgi:GrpB-like predicted nucleotidyltransferase (UPF0157 family)